MPQKASTFIQSISFKLNSRDSWDGVQRCHSATRNCVLRWRNGIVPCRRGSTMRIHTSTGDMVGHGYPIMLALCSPLGMSRILTPDVCGLHTADVINDLAMFIDMVAVLIPSRFLLLICVSSVLKSMSVPEQASPVEFCHKCHPPKMPHSYPKCLGSSESRR
jgi:hypothetical protein